MKLFIQGVEITKEFGVRLPKSKYNGASKIIIHIKELALKKPPENSLIKLGDIIRGMRIIKKLYFVGDILPLLKRDGLILLENKQGFRDVTKIIKQIKEK